MITPVLPHLFGPQADLELAVVYMVRPAASLLSAAFVGHLVDVKGWRSTIGIPYVFFVVGAFAFLYNHPSTAPPPTEPLSAAFYAKVAVFAIGRFLQGIADSFMWAAGLTAIICTHKREHSAALGALVLTADAGSVIGPALGGFLYDGGGSWLAFGSLVLLTLSVWALAAALQPLFPTEDVMEDDLDDLLQLWSPSRAGDEVADPHRQSPTADYVPLAPSFPSPLTASHRSGEGDTDGKVGSSLLSPLKLEPRKSQEEEWVDVGGGGAIVERKPPDDHTQKRQWSSLAANDHRAVIAVDTFSALPPQSPPWDVPHMTEVDDIECNNHHPQPQPQPQPNLSLHRDNHKQFAKEQQQQEGEGDGQNDQLLDESQLSVCGRRRDSTAAPISMWLSSRASQSPSSPEAEAARPAPLERRSKTEPSVAVPTATEAVDTRKPEPPPWPRSRDSEQGVAVEGVGVGVSVGAAPSQQPAVVGLADSMASLASEAGPTSYRVLMEWHFGVLLMSELWVYCALAALFSVLPVHWKQAYNLDASRSGVLLLPLTACKVIEGLVVPIFIPFLSRKTSRPLYLLCVVSVLVGGVSLYLILRGTEGTDSEVAWLALFGVSYGIYDPLSQAFSMQYAMDRGLTSSFGKMQSCLEVAGHLGMFLGPVILGVAPALSVRTGMTAVGVCGIAVGLLAAVSFVFFRPEKFAASRRAARFHALLRLKRGMGLRKRWVARSLRHRIHVWRFRRYQSDLGGALLNQGVAESLLDRHHGDGSTPPHHMHVSVAPPPLPRIEAEEGGGAYRYQHMDMAALKEMKEEHPHLFDTL
ncbi:unnamed protein product [Vitrella brassicaformis CCMP3155]|uniref:Major facilitator superfamily (MFS) profile domain-containing protein n=1 Tax=Vitrella brassicaformis (strain CCMP3155) TaxID=1169540 RepID=A0A0G4FA79_VITBC|nr:unnamed protein product [Vitrella brassicaformis CCMP3155]|eukprot:CEM09882.1 unnamed protein product [Vitrella brassicaformis CCMP3155]